MFALRRRFSTVALLELAREVDAGFQIRIFVEMIAMLARYRDVDPALGDVDVTALRAFFQKWRAELTKQG